jgi:hypothetical protein
LRFMGGIVIRGGFVHVVIVYYIVPSAVSATAIALLLTRNIVTITIVFSEGKAHFRLSSFYK